MDVIERKIKGVITPIGTIEMIERGSWIWTSFKVGAEFEYDSEVEGCACNRRDAEREVRECYREALKECNLRNKPTN